MITDQTANAINFNSNASSLLGDDLFDLIEWGGGPSKGQMPAQMLDKAIRD